MQRISAIIIFLLVVSMPLPVFASASGKAHCDMKATHSDPGSTMAMGAESAESGNADCCDCVEGATCNVPCAAGTAFVPHSHGSTATPNDGKGYFGPVPLSIFPAPPDKLLRPPISLS